MRRRILHLVAVIGAEDLWLGAHIYGGGLLASIGIAALCDRPSVGLLTFGVLLVYISLRRT